MPTNASPGLTADVTAVPTALRCTSPVKERTTSRETSASISAMRTSRTDALTFSSVR